MRRPDATKAFVRSVLSEVRWKQAHSSIERELGDHVEDQARAFVAAGMDEAAAETAAIRDMGDPLTLGAALDAAWRPRPTWRALLPFGMTLLLGLLLHLLLYAPMEHYQAYAGETVLKELIALAVGGILFTVVYVMNFNTLAKLCLPLGTAMLLFFLLVYTRYYHSESVAVNALLLLPLLTAGSLYTLRRLRVGAAILTGGLISLAAILFMAGEYYGEALHLAVLVSFAVLLTGILLGACRGRKWLLLLALVVIFLALCAHTFLTKPELFEQFIVRALHFPKGSAIEARELLQGTRWIGKGSLEFLSSETLSLYSAENGYWAAGFRWVAAVQYLPLYVCYRYGRLAALLLTALPLAAIVAGGLRVLRLSGKLGRLLGLAALYTLLAQWLAGVLVSCGAICFTAYPLPFLTVGYYALIVDMALTGVVCSVLRTDGLR